MRKTYLICYDIRDDKRLTRVAKTMRGFGDRVQYSVFECQIEDIDLVRCRAALGQIIDHEKDQGAQSLTLAWTSSLSPRTDVRNRRSVGEEWKDSHP